MLEFFELLIHSKNKAALDNTNTDDNNVSETNENVQKENNTEEDKTIVNVEAAPPAMARPKNDQNETSETSNQLNIDSQMDIKQIETIVKQILGSETTKNFTSELSTEIASKVQNSILEVLNKKKEPVNSLKSENSKFNDECWEEFDDYYICTPCALNHKRKDVPLEYKPSIKAGYSMIKKHSNKKKFHITSSKNEHNQLELHGWCVGKYKTEKNEKLTYDQSNAEAGKKIIKNAVYCFQNSLGARNFLGLNALNYSCHFEITATKNDSEKEFFRLRNVVFDLLTEKTHKFFQENVNQISVSLDKVTVQRRSYTVVVTFFFYDGHIHVILNKLQKLGTLDYDGNGMAKMLVSVLTETLGITETKLAMILRVLIFSP